jgi:hypothetical protein
MRCLAGIEPAVLAAGLEPASSFDPGSEPGGYAIRLREREHASMLWATGFEPMASSVGSEPKCSTTLSYTQSMPRMVRTPRVELGWNAYKASWLHRSHVRICRPPAVDPEWTESSLLDGVHGGLRSEAKCTQRELLIRKLRATGPS